MSLPKTQTANTVVMVPPKDFEFNEETAETNVFQNKPPADIGNISEMASRDFYDTVEELRRNRLKVILMPNREDDETKTPDAIFPNNWFSIHNDVETDQRTLVLYPMFAENRRAEVRPQSLLAALGQAGLKVQKIVDLTEFANRNLFLEGTGSLVLDRTNGIVYASLSQRTSSEMVDIFADRLNYSSVVKFRSYDRHDTLIYHTNVMISVGSTFAVVALDTIRDKVERDALLCSLMESGKEIVPITLEQVERMCGNILHVEDDTGKKRIIASTMAFTSFTLEQQCRLRAHGDWLVVDINTIEKVAGGGVRCMLAEVF